MKSFVKVIGKLWIGCDGATEYPVSKAVLDLKPFNKENIIKYFEGKDFQEIYDCEALIEFDWNEETDPVVDWEIITYTQKFYHFKWENEENECKYLDCMFGDE